AGQVVVEQASVPAGGLAPFVSLARDQVVRDPWLFVLPPDLAPGVYELNLGRRLAEGSWLAVRRGTFALADTCPLATVHVLGRKAE
ncbi:MAG: hypothetical protein ACP5JJ_16865, partial [Anaerolineae bacterium]